MATVPEQAAIDSINQLTSLIEHGPTTASGTLRIPSNAHVAEAADGGKRQLTTSETTFVRQTQPANSALAELQRRFPTISRGRAAANRDPVSGRYRRPSNSTSTFVFFSLKIPHKKKAYFPYKPRVNFSVSAWPLCYATPPPSKAYALKSNTAGHDKMRKNEKK